MVLEYVWEGCIARHPPPLPRFHLRFLSLNFPAISYRLLWRKIVPTKYSHQTPWKWLKSCQNYNYIFFSFPMNQDANEENNFISIVLIISLFCDENLCFTSMKWSIIDIEKEISSSLVCGFHSWKLRTMNICTNEDDPAWWRRWHNV